MQTGATDGAVRVLLIDDDQDEYLIVRGLLQDIPGGRYRLDWVADYDQGLEAIGRGDHQVYLIDYRLGPRDGLSLLQEAQARHPGAPMILLTGRGELDVDFAAMEAGAADFLDKNRLDAVLLDRSIRYALQQKRHEAELERKVAERTEELAKANAALREADQRKNEFLATLAHELRNPLAPIRNALEIMRLAGGNAMVQERSRSVIERQVSQMVRLIEDLLDVSRISRGKLQLNLDSVDLREAVEAALETSRPLLDKAKLKLTVSLPRTEVRLEADRVRLSQILANLLNNAARFTDPGGSVRLSAEVDGSMVAIEVRDTGMGFEPHMVPELFQFFMQGRPPPTGAQVGLGIGLALVRRLTELHGGSVSAHSDGPGRGAEFVVRLPLARESSSRNR